MTILQGLFGQLSEHGGAIVSSNECSEMEIADARATGRMAVVDDIGYIRRTKEWLDLQKSRELKGVAVAGPDSTRTWVATMALNGLCDRSVASPGDRDVIVKRAVEMADRLIEKLGEGR